MNQTNTKSFFPQHYLYTNFAVANDKALNITCPESSRLVVCSDSLSALQALEDLFPTAPSYKISLSLKPLLQRNLKYLLCWFLGIQT